MDKAEHRPIVCNSNMKSPGNFEEMMASLKSIIEAITVRASSVDGSINAVLSNRSEVEIDFTSDSYETLSVQEIEVQLASALERVWDGARDGYCSAYTKATGREPKDLADSWNSAQRRYASARDSLTSGGVSANGYMSVSATGLSGWKCHVEDEALELSQQEFANEFSSAVRELVTEYEIQLAGLKLRNSGQEHRLPKHLKLASIS